MKPTRYRILSFLFILISVLIFSGCTSDAERAAKHFDKGLLLVKQQKERAAILEFLNVVKIDPKHAEARYQLGLLYLKAGDSKQAFQQLRTAADLAPENLDAQAKTAEFFLLGNNREECRHYLSRVFDIKPDDANGLSLLANLELLEKNYETAMDAILRATAIEPGNDRFHLIAGKIHAASGKIAEAETSFLKAIELNNKNKINYTMLSDLYMFLGSDDKIRELARKMILIFPEDPQPHIRLGLLDIKERKFSQAEGHLQNALKIAPEDIELRLRLSEFYKKTGQMTLAVQVLSDVPVSADPDNLLQAQLGHLYFEQTKFDEARAIMKKLLADKPTHPGARMLSARFLLQEQSFHKALEILNDLAKAYPDWADVSYSKSIAHAGRGDLESAKNSALEAISLKPGAAAYHSFLSLLHLRERDIVNARREAGAALELDLNDFQAAMVLAESLLLSGDFDPARKILEQLHKKYPENLEVMKELGRAYTGLGNQGKAVALSEKILGLQPDDEEAGRLLLAFRNQTGVTLDDWIGKLKKLTEEDPDKAGLWFQLGRFLQVDGRTDEALESFVRARDLAPEESRAYMMIGALLRETGQVDQALAEFTRLTREKPDNIGAYMSLGVLHEQMGAFGEAKKNYEKLLEIKSDFAPAANNLAWILTIGDKPDYREALRLAKIAKSRLPEDPNITDTLGMVYLKNDSIHLAYIELANAVEKNPFHPLFRYHLGLVLYEKGNKEQAMRELDNVLNTTRGFRERKEVEDTLERWRQEKIEKFSTPAAHSENR